MVFVAAVAKNYKLKCRCHIKDVSWSLYNN